MMKFGKFFLIGFGGGIALTSLLFFIILTSVGDHPVKVEMTEQEIVERATELGMISMTDLPKKDTMMTEAQIIEKAKELGMEFAADQNETVEKNQDTEAAEDDVISEEPVEIFIYNGTSSMGIARILYDHELIEDMDQFNSFIKAKNMTTRLRSGRFLIPHGSTYDEILDILLRTPE